MTAGDDIWVIIGMAKRLERLSHKMHDAAIDGKIIEVQAISTDGTQEFLGRLALDYNRE